MEGQVWKFELVFVSNFGLRDADNGNGSWEGLHKPSTTKHDELNLAYANGKGRQENGLFIICDECLTLFWFYSWRENFL